MWLPLSLLARSVSRLAAGTQTEPRPGLLRQLVLCLLANQVSVLLSHSPQYYLVLLTTRRTTARGAPARPGAAEWLWTRAPASTGRRASCSPSASPPSTSSTGSATRRSLLSGVCPSLYIFSPLAVVAPIMTRLWSLYWPAPAFVLWQGEVTFTWDDHQLAGVWAGDAGAGWRVSPNSFIFAYKLHLA